MSIEDIDFYTYKIGGLDPNGEIITDIYIVDENYILYEIKKNGLVNKIVKSTVSENIEKIEELIAEFSTYLNGRKIRRKNAQLIANAISYCLSGKSDVAEKYLNRQISISHQQRITENRLSYLKSCILIVSLNSLITIYLNFFLEENLISDQLVFLFTLVTFGSYGGFISVFLKVSNIDVEVFARSRVQIWLGISRIFIAMISSLIVYALIKANFIFGFINDYENIYVFFTMASLSGLSEYFIPNSLKSLEKA